jgi:tRNA modification GTPase
MEDTIAAISTPIGQGGIAIVRVSGTRAFAIADAIFSSRRGRPSQFPSHTIHFGTAGGNGDTADQVMLTVMHAPRTYTTEDVVEINCHGGWIPAKKILSLCLQHGARLAEPGEFTKRAFLNGRIDLIQAEAVMDLIQARTDRAQSAAIHALQGHLSARVTEARDRLVTILAHVEAHIDFPDEDVAPDTREKLLQDLESVTNFLRGLLATAGEGRILREGVSLAIVGRPNVGKSSIMNALLGHDRSIVTSIPGTTRDTIEELANIRGIPVRLTDTAGIRKAYGAVEKLGVGRSRTALQHSDLALHILDGSQPLSDADLRIAGLCDPRRTIIVCNKVDLPVRLKLPRELESDRTVEVSALTGKGIEELKDRMEALVWSGCGGSMHLGVAVNERHADALRRSIKLLTSALSEMRANSPLEVLAQLLRAGLDDIGEIVGKTATDDILERIFSTFCIGK